MHQTSTVAQATLLYSSLSHTMPSAPVKRRLRDMDMPISKRSKFSYGFHEAQSGDPSETPCSKKQVPLQATAYNNSYIQPVIDKLLQIQNHLSLKQLLRLAKGMGVSYAGESFI